MISVIIPTFNEKENIEKLIPGIFGQFLATGMEGEVIIVDDNSPDGTADAAEAFRNRFNVRVLRRPGKMGLSTAVLEGFRKSNSPFLCVMDADHSHNPEAIPRMFKVLMRQGADVVIGSRHVPGGSITGWPFHRKLISRGAKVLARPITDVKDPLSGFFMLRRDALEGVELNPRGYKILLEILAKGKIKKVEEVPISFRDRKHGDSKLKKGEFWNYLRHSMGLWRSKRN